MPVHSSLFYDFSFLSVGKERSHEIRGILSLSMDQSSSFKRGLFSSLKRLSKTKVACNFKGDNLLCSIKNCSLLIVIIIYYIDIYTSRNFLQNRRSKGIFLVFYLFGNLFYQFFNLNNRNRFYCFLHFFFCRQWFGLCYSFYCLNKLIHFYIQYF